MKDKIKKRITEVIIGAEEPMTAMDISKVLNIAYSTALKYVDILQAERIIDYTKLGRVKAIVKKS